VRTTTRRRRVSIRSLGHPGERSLEVGLPDGKYTDVADRADGFAVYDLPLTTYQIVADSTVGAGALVRVPMEARGLEYDDDADHNRQKSAKRPSEARSPIAVKECELPEANSATSRRAASDRPRS
jgi:hypothetical protein